MNPNYEKLLSKIVEKAIEDYKTLSELGLVHRGKLDAKRMALNEIKILSHRHKKKSIRYIWVKLYRANVVQKGLFSREEIISLISYGKKSNTVPVRLLPKDVSFEDCFILINFLNGEFYRTLCHSIGVNGDSLLLKLFRTDWGFAQAIESRRKENSGQQS